MVFKELTITNPEGLKAKAAASFVQIANQYESQILIEFSNKKINAKSIMGLLSLGVGSGDSIYVFSTGSDEKAALDALVDFASTNLS